MDLAAALVLASISVASLHALAPDHWVPFAALARAQGWSRSRTALITTVCGVGHVSVSVAVALVSVFFGVELLETFGQRLEGVAGLLLIGFGVAYAAWGLGRAVRARLHERFSDHDHHHHHRDHHPHHHHHDHQHDHAGHQGTAWSLFLLFSADPCVAVIPLLFAAAPLGWTSTLAVVLAYQVATIVTMVTLVLPARAAAVAVRGSWADRYGDVLAGGVIAVVGLVVTTLGI